MIFSNVLLSWPIYFPKERKIVYCNVATAITVLSSGALKMRWFGGRIIGGVRCVTKLSSFLDELSYSICFWKVKHLFQQRFSCWFCGYMGFCTLIFTSSWSFSHCRIVVCSYVLSGGLECTEAVQRSTQTFLTSRKVLFFLQCVALPSLLSPPVCLPFTEGWKRHINDLTKRKSLGWSAGILVSLRPV